MKAYRLTENEWWGILEGCTPILHQDMRVGDLQALPELVKARDWVAEQGALKSGQREWNQDTWFDAVVDEETDALCGTQYCVAGRIAISSAQPVVTPYGVITKYVRDETGRFWTISYYAAYKMGMSRDDAGPYFNGSNTAAELVSLLNLRIQLVESRALS